jgi:hypothetical protein
MEQNPAYRFDNSPLALSHQEMHYLRDIPHPGVPMPCAMRLRFFANDCIHINENKLALTPRGRTALLMGRL